VCRAATGTGDFGELFPGGRAFTLCQPSASWGATDQAFAELLPEGGKWTAATAHPVCTPLPARPGLFGASVLCAGTLPEALAYAADLRTVKDRCVGGDSAQEEWRTLGIEQSFCGLRTTRGLCCSLPVSSWRCGALA
jgi:hypothetical protein